MDSKTSKTPQRFTCRDEDGRARLMPNVYVLDVIEHLCRIEERAMGVLVVGRDEAQQKSAEGGKARWIK